jgi:hypothetical protein
LVFEIFSRNKSVFNLYFRQLTGLKAVGVRFAVGQEQIARGIEIADSAVMARVVAAPSTRINSARRRGRYQSGIRETGETGLPSAPMFR